MLKTLSGNRFMRLSEQQSKRLPVLLGSLFLLASISLFAAPFAYITNQGADNVSVIDLGIDKVVATIPTGKAPVGVTIDHFENRLYVTNVESRSISIIDMRTNKLIGEINLTISPVGITLSKNASQLFVADWFQDRVMVFDTKDVLAPDAGKHYKEVSMGKAPAGMVVSREGASLYVANRDSNEVGVIDVRSLKVVNKRI